jgi:hypothetical protein
MTSQLEMLIGNVDADRAEGEQSPHSALSFHQEDDFRVAVPVKTIDLHIEPKAVKHTQKGPYYNARLQRPDGEIIVCSTEPLFAACRELVKRGITGNIRKYRNGVLSAEGDIEQFAGLTVVESDTEGPVIRKYHEHPRAVVRRAQKTVETLSGVPDTPRATKAAGGETRPPSDGRPPLERARP